MNLNTLKGLVSYDLHRHILPFNAVEMLMLTPPFSIFFFFLVITHSSIGGHDLDS